MSHLHQVIDLDASAQARFADRGPVDAGVGLHFNAVFDDHGPGGRDLVIRAVGLLGEPEAVGPNHRAVLQDAVARDPHVLAHDRVGVGQEAVADLSVPVDHHKALEHAVVSKHDAFLNHHVRTDGGITAEPDIRADDGGRVDAGSGSRRRPKQLDGLGECQVRVVGAQQGAAGRVDVRAHDNRCRARSLKLTAVLGIGEERHFAFRSLVHSRDTRNLHVGRSFRTASEPDGKVSQFHSPPFRDEPGKGKVSFRRAQRIVSVSHTGL